MNVCVNIWIIPACVCLCTFMIFFLYLSIPFQSLCNICAASAAKNTSVCSWKVMEESENLVKKKAEVPWQRWAWQQRLQSKGSIHSYITTKLQAAGHLSWALTTTGIWEARDALSNIRRVTMNEGSLQSTSRQRVCVCTRAFSIFIHIWNRYIARISTQPTETCPPEQFFQISVDGLNFCPKIRSRRYCHLAPRKMKQVDNHETTQKKDLERNWRWTTEKFIVKKLKYF